MCKGKKSSIFSMAKGWPGHAEVVLFLGMGMRLVCPPQKIKGYVALENNGK
jgi:hypothetical protein